MIDYDDDWVSWGALPLASMVIPSINHSLHLIILIKVPDIVSALPCGDKVQTVFPHPQAPSPSVGKGSMFLTPPLHPWRGGRGVRTCPPRLH